MTTATAPAELGRHIRTARQDAGLTQAALAAAAGITRPHLAQIEAGTYACKAATLFALADALNTTADNLRRGSLSECTAGRTLGTVAKRPPKRQAIPCPPRSKSTGQKTTRRRTPNDLAT